MQPFIRFYKEVRTEPNIVSIFCTETPFEDKEQRKASEIEWISEALRILKFVL